MRVDAVLCDTMTVREGLLHVLGGGITQLNRDTYPALLLVDIAAWIEDDTRPSAGLKQYAVRAVLRSDVGEVGAVDAGVNLNIPPGLEEPVLMSMPIWIGHLQVPAAGRYFVDILVNNALLRTLWFRVNAAPRPSAAPAPT